MSDKTPNSQAQAMNTGVQSSHGGPRWRNRGGGAPRATPAIVRVLKTQMGTVARMGRLAFHNPTRRALLKLLCTHDNGVTYTQAQAALPVSERWVRQLVADLRADGIVETPGNPALIQFTSRDVMIAVKEVIQFLASDWVEAITPANGGHPAGERTAQGGGETTTAGSDPPDGVNQYLKTVCSIIRGRCS